jgi:hypothetical protein
MKKLFMTAVVLGILCLSAQGPAADDPLAAWGAGWQVEKKSDTFRIYTQPIPGKDVPMVQVVGIVDAPPQSVFQVVTDYAHFEDFMPYMEVCHVIHTEQIDPHTRVNYVFFFVNPPLIAGRFYTLKLTDQSDETIEGVAGSYRSQWDLVTNGVYHETPESPGIQQLVHDKDAVETRNNQGFWLMQPLDGGQKTRVIYQVMTDPGGTIPHWVANKAQMTTLPDLFSTISNRIQSTKSKG